MLTTSVQRSVKNTCPTCETVPDIEEDVWIMRLMWLAPSEVCPGKMVWNSATPSVADVKAPRKKLSP